MANEAHAADPRRPDTLTASHALIAEFETAMEAALAAETDLKAKLAQATADLATASARIAELEAAQTGEAAAPAAKAAKPPKGKIAVTVLRGSVTHPEADGGEALAGTTFHVAAKEREDLQGLADRGVIRFDD